MARPHLRCRCQPPRRLPPGFAAAPPPVAPAGCPPPPAPAPAPPATPAGCVRAGKGGRMDINDADCTMHTPQLGESGLARCGAVQAAIPVQCPPTFRAAKLSSPDCLSWSAPRDSHHCPTLLAAPWAACRSGLAPREGTFLTVAVRLAAGKQRAGGSSVPFRSAPPPPPPPPPDSCRPAGLTWPATLPPAHSREMATSPTPLGSLSTACRGSSSPRASPSAGGRVGRPCSPSAWLATRSDLRRLRGGVGRAPAPASPCRPKGACR